MLQQLTVPIAIAGDGSFSVVAAAAVVAAGAAVAVDAKCVSAADANGFVLN